MLHLRWVRKEVIHHVEEQPPKWLRTTETLPCSLRVALLPARHPLQAWYFQVGIFLLIPFYRFSITFFLENGNTVQNPTLPTKVSLCEVLHCKYTCNRAQSTRDRDTDIVCHSPNSLLLIFWPSKKSDKNIGLQHRCCLRVPHAVYDCDSKWAIQSTATQLTRQGRHRK